jgi:Zinc finger, C3HC4 type (RING finger)/Zinc finger C-x8-C-x5-C-x3-H type (and similar)
MSPPGSTTEVTAEAVIISATSAAARSRPHCIYFARSGYCRNGPACRFQHSSTAFAASAPPAVSRNPGKALRRRMRKAAEVRREDAQQDCGICFDNPAKSHGRYGILIGCDHPFCVECLRKWRASAEESSVDGTVDKQRMRKSCPVCRAPSDFVVPSFTFVTGEEKERMLAGYRKNCEGVECRLYAAGGRCPFSYRCHYKHVRPDGTVVDKADLAEAASKDGSEFPGAEKLAILDREQRRQHLRDHHARAAFSAELMRDMAGRTQLAESAAVNQLAPGAGQSTPELLDDVARLIAAGDCQVGLEILLAGFEGVDAPASSSERAGPSIE